MRKLALAALLAFAATALADTPPENVYDGVFNSVNPPTAFVFVTLDGPPKTLVADPGGTFAFNPETGVYVGPGGDTYWFSGGIAHYIHVLPPPAMGPFPEKSGPYWRAP